MAGVLSSGCISSRELKRTPGAPNRAVKPYTVIEKVESEFNLEQLMDQYYDRRKELTKNGAVLTSSGRNELQAMRDEIVASQVTLINLYYQEFVVSATFRRQIMNFSADMAELGLNLATTAVGAKGTKTILAAISSGITGTRSQINETFFFEKTMSAIVTAMDAKRKEAYEPLKRGQGASVSEYPLEAALNDLHAYYYAGTFLGAIDLLETKANDAEQAASEALEQVDKEKFASSKNRQLLRDFVYPEQEGRFIKLSAWLNDQNIDSSPRDFIRKREFAAGRKALLAAVLADRNQRVLPEFDADGVTAESDDFDIQESFLRYFEPNSTENVQKLKAWLKLNDLDDVTPYEFLNLAAYEEARTRAVKGLKLESDGR